MKAAVVVTGLALVAAGCGSGSLGHDALVTGPAATPAPVSSTAAAPTPAPRATDRPPHGAAVRPPIAKPECSGGASGSPHFDTAEAAMRYLATAWNTNDLDALCHVTNPNARMLLLDMHRDAVNLRLDHCRHLDDGGAQCVFRHYYPPTMHRHGTGRTWLDAAPARNPGWYMTVFVGCG
jgi:hypothetical protein